MNTNPVNAAETNALSYIDLNFFILFDPIYSPINGAEACVGP